MDPDLKDAAREARNRLADDINNVVDPITLREQGLALLDAYASWLVGVNAEQVAEAVGVPWEATQDDLNEEILRAVREMLMKERNRPVVLAADLGVPQEVSEEASVAALEGDYNAVVYEMARERLRTALDYNLASIREEIAGHEKQREEEEEGYTLTPEQLDDLREKYETMGSCPFSGIPSLGNTCPICG